MGIKKLLEQPHAIDVAGLGILIDQTRSGLKITVNANDEFPHHPSFTFILNDDSSQTGTQNALENPLIANTLEFINLYYETVFFSDVDINEDAIRNFDMAEWLKQIEICIRYIIRNLYGLEVPHQTYQKGFCWKFELGDYRAEFRVDNDQTAEHRPRTNYHFLRFSKNDGILVITIKPETQKEDGSYFEPTVHFRIRGMDQVALIKDMVLKKSTLIKFQILLTTWMNLREKRKENEEKMRELAFEIKARIAGLANKKREEAGDRNYLLERFFVFLNQHKEPT